MREGRRRHLCGFSAGAGDRGTRPRHAGAAATVRERLEARLGGGLARVVPGTDDAAALKAALIDEGLWSQYLEVTIGPDAEIFTKAPLLATVGWGAPVGVRSDSTWNNPEPEVVLLVDAAGHPIGATLANDVNLRDFEGRALLLGKAKDNNASCSLSAFVRLFDDRFTMDDVRAAEVDLRIEGEDGYVLDGNSCMDQISRDPEDASEASRDQPEDRREMEEAHGSQGSADRSEGSVLDGADHRG